MKLSATNKNEITSDWARLFPELSVYQPMWLLRRVSPLVVGIRLERDSSNESYRPTFHVHNLCKKDEGLSLTLAEALRTAKTGAPETIKVAFHRERYVEAAERMKKQALLPLGGPISLKLVIKAYREYMTRPLWKYPLVLYEDIITLQVWCGREDDARKSLDEFVDNVNSWPASVDLSPRANNVDEWRTKYVNWIGHPELIRITVNEQIVAHRLTEVRASELLPE